LRDMGDRYCRFTVSALKRLPVEVRVSHISQKTSEIWGTL
jgi:hypothetical protein